MNGSDCFDGLKLHDDFVYNHQIGTKPLSQFNRFIYNGDGQLPYYLEIPLFEFVCEYLFVYGFQQSRPKRRVNFIGRIHDNFRDLILRHDPSRYLKGNRYFYG